MDVNNYAPACGHIAGQSMKIKNYDALGIFGN